jgi:hypothetical protein
MVALCGAGQNERARAAARATAAQRTWQSSANVLLALLDGEPPARQKLSRAPGLAAAFTRKVLRKLSR